MEILHSPQQWPDQKITFTPFAEKPRFLWTIARPSQGAATIKSKSALSAKVFRLPSLDHLLDGLPVLDIFIEDAAREIGQFGVACKTQSDQLVHRELRDTRLQVSG